MPACMCVCMCAFIHLRMCSDVHLYLYVYMYIRIYYNTYVDIYIMYACISVRMQVSARRCVVASPGDSGWLLHHAVKTTHTGGYGFCYRGKTVSLLVFFVVVWHVFAYQVLPHIGVQFRYQS